MLDFRVVDFAAESCRFAWSYKHAGDYNQDGEVNVSDLTPIGAHFNRDSNDLEWPRAMLADGDGNQFITIADVTPIGSNFGSRVTGYYLQTRSDSHWQTVGEIAIADGEIPLSGGYRHYSLLLAQPDWGHDYRVVPFAVSGDGSTTGAPGNVAVAPDPGKTSFGSWSQYRIGQMDGSQHFYDLAAAATSSGPAVIWYDVQALEVRAAVAQSQQPLSAAEWDVRLLQDDRFGTSWGVDIAECAGAPCAVFVGPDGNVYFARYTNVVGWTAHNITVASGGFFYYPAIEEVAGKPAVLLAGRQLTTEIISVHYVYTDLTSPSSLADWTHSVCFQEYEGFTVDLFPGRPLSMVEIEDKPVAAFLTSSAGQQRQMIARAKSRQPQSPADWVFYTLHGESGFVDIERGLDGLPQLVNENREFYLCELFQHSRKEDWNYIFPIQEFSGPQLTQLEIIAGLPTMSWRDPTGLWVSQGRLPRPGVTEWFQEDVNGQVTGGLFRMSQANNSPVLFIKNGNGIDFCFATSE